MSDSAIATQPLPQKLTDDEPADQNNESSPVDIKAKSPTPSDENSKLPQIVEDKTEQDNDCLIIDDDEEPPTIEKAVGVEQNNEETKQFDDIPTLTIDESVNIEKTQKEAEKLSIETNEVEENKEEVKAEEEKTVQSNETNAVQSTSSAEINVESEQASTSQATIPPIDLKQTVTTTAPPILSTSTPLTATPSQTATSVSSALASSMIKKPRKPRGLKNETKKPDMNPAPFMTHLTAQNGVMGTIQMGNNGQPQVLTLPPGFKLPQPINMPPTATGTTPSLMPVQIRPCYTQTSNGQVFFYPSPFQPGQQLTPPNNNQGAKPTMQRKNGKDKESPVGQKPANPVNNVTTAPMILRDPQGNYRIQMAPGQVPNSQTIQHLFQAANSGMVMKQIPATSTTQSTSNKPGTSANSASQPQFTAAPTNLFYTMRGGTTPIPIRSLNAQPMMNNQYLNLVPVSLPPNVHYQMAAEMHPPPPTLSPNLATPTSKSPKPTTSNSANNNTKKKKLISGTSSNGTSTSSGMFANVASKFMSTFNVNPPNVTLKAMKISAPVEERPEIDNDPADDEPPPQIECEGPTGNTNSNGRQNQQQQANNSFLQAARNQNIQKSKLPTQPHLKKHYIDGRIVEEELPGYKNNSTPTKQRMLGQPPILPVKERPATVLNNLKTALNRVQPVTAKAPASSRPLSSSFQPPPIVKPANL
ncbi:hypothetical protein M3Y97_00508900 [Aphelenchoides bicaudatus]|nr:hypothetical protein M3Y97_00508900 [Aphelenchoides bicaudatus]